MKIFLQANLSNLKEFSKVPQKFGHPLKKIGKIMKNSAIDSFWLAASNPVINLKLQ